MCGERFLCKKCKWSETLYFRYIVAKSSLLGIVDVYTDVLVILDIIRLYWPLWIDFYYDVVEGELVWVVSLVIFWFSTIVISNIIQCIYLYNYFNQQSQLSQENSIPKLIVSMLCALFGCGTVPIAYEIWHDTTNKDKYHFFLKLRCIESICESIPSATLNLSSFIFFWVHYKPFRSPLRIISAIVSCISIGSSIIKYMNNYHENILNKKYSTVWYYTMLQAGIMCDFIIRITSIGFLVPSVQNEDNAETAFEDPVVGGFNDLPFESNRMKVILTIISLSLFSVITLFVVIAMTLFTKEKIYNLIQWAQGSDTSADMANLDSSNLYVNKSSRKRTFVFGVIIAILFAPMPSGMCQHTTRLNFMLCPFQKTKKIKYYESKKCDGCN